MTSYVFIIGLQKNLKKIKTFQWDPFHLFRLKVVFFSFCIFQVRKRLPGGKRCKMMSILASERFLTLEVVSALSCRDKHTEAVEFDRLAKVWR